MQTAISKLFFLSLLGFASTIPFNLDLSFTNVKINNIFLILSVATGILLAFRTMDRNTKSGRMTLWFISLYLLFVIGLIHTDDHQQAFSDLTEKKGAILIFPLIFYFTPALREKQITTILLTFASSCLLTAVFCLSIAGYRFLSGEEASFLTYHSLSQLAGMHAIYLAMCFYFSIGIIFYFWVWKQQKPKTRISVPVCYLAMVFLAISIFLLAARTHIFLLIISVIVLAIYSFSKNNSMIVALIKALGIGVIIFGTMLLFPENRERFKQLINYKGQYGLSKQWGEQQMRPFMWSCAFKLIKASPVVGWGTGDVLDKLHQCYIDNQYTTLTYFEDVRFNAHNQFLEITIGFGLIGLALFIFILYRSLSFGLKRRKFLYSLFLILFIISCLTESILERHNGVVFYAFFNSLLFFHSQPAASVRTKPST